MAIITAGRQKPGISTGASEDDQAKGKATVAMLRSLDENVENILFPKNDLHIPKEAARYGYVQYHKRIASMQRREKIKAVDRIADLASSSSAKVAEEALGALFSMANSSSDTVGQIALHGFKRIMAVKEGDARIAAFDRLKPLVIMDYRNAFDPNRDYSKVIEAVNSDKAINDKIKAERVSQIKNQQSKGPIVIRELEWARLRTGKFLARLLMGRDPLLDSMIWGMIESAVNDKRSEMENVGQEMISIALASGKVSIVTKAEKINSDYKSNGK
ncbi:MAG: hypothetical protein ACREBH_00745 [Candidatus Micrarchaeaceae archaeon]